MKNSRRGLLRAALLAAVGISLPGVSLAALYRDQLVSGGGQAAETATQMSWAVLGEPVGGRMSGGGFVIQGGGGPPPAGNAAPSITSFAPADWSRFYRQDRVTLIVAAVDPDGDPLEYRFLLDGQTLRDWSALPTALWETDDLVFGRHTLRVEARDPTHTVSRESRPFLFHRPPSP